MLVTTPIPETETDAKARVYRFPVNQDTGEYDSAPIQLNPKGNADERLAERKVRGLLHQDSGSGIAFATLPLKDDPASSAACCYLINRQLLNYTTVWTRAPWNDHPELKDQPSRFQVKEAPPDPSPRFLLALNTGEVLDIQIGPELSGKRTIAAESLCLPENPDVWRLLRNGCVAGVGVHADGTPLPIFSIASIHVQPSAERSPRSTEITGTLDFKWRPGSTIKVRFTDFNPLTAYGVKREDAIRRIAALAETWLEGGVDLHLKFLDLDEPAPLDPALDDYDVLVSLEPLGRDSTVTTRNQPLYEGAETVLFPMSQLGSYAEREERDEPTMFLGHPKGLKSFEGKELPIEKYFDSKMFKHIVLHEFGHALGLPHLHQHPGLKKNPFERFERQALAAEIQRALGIPVNEAFVREELQGRWPGARYSEWPAIRDGESDADAIKRWLASSVMIGLPSRQIILEGARQAGPRDTLGETDRAWIKLLYPPKP